MLGLLARVAIDVTPLRARPAYRTLVIGSFISALGSQAALVALPIQIYLVSHSATLVGLLGAFELGPMIVVSLVGGAYLDRHDRRPILAWAQVLSMVISAALALIAGVDGHAPVLLVLVLGGVLAGASSLNAVAYSAIAPRLLGPEYLRSGLALAYGLGQAASIVGPGLGGVLIAATGVKWIYVVNGLSCLGMLVAALKLAPQPPTQAADRVQHLTVRRSIAEGLSFVARTRALAGSFLADINAMTFGMPRALFAVLSLTVYHAGATGTGLLYVAIAVGGAVAVLTSGWLARARRLGWIVLGCVLFWGLTILGAGLVRGLWPALVLLGLAGWADGFSAVARTTMSQTLTPEAMRGRMSSVYSLVVTGGVRLGDMESGLVAGLFGALDSVLIGGAACIVGVGAVLVAFPQLAAYDAERAVAEMTAAEAAGSGEVQLIPG